MKKSHIKIGILFLAIAFIFILTGKVNAATAPVLQTIGGKECFFANGTAITIEERTDQVEGAKITWNGGEQLVGTGITVFGGMHGDDTEVNTSITMNGGTIKNIFGGGLHLSKTITAKIVVNDGKVSRNYTEEELLHF